MRGVQNLHQHRDRNAHVSAPGQERRVTVHLIGYVLTIDAYCCTQPMPLIASTELHHSQLKVGALLREVVLRRLDPHKYEPKFDLRGQGSELDHLNSITGRYDYEPGVNGMDVWPTKEQRFLDVSPSTAAHFAPDNPAGFRCVSRGCRI